MLRRRKKKNKQARTLYYYGFGIFLFMLLILLTVAGCRQDYSPKPDGYLRIDPHPKAYKLQPGRLNGTSRTFLFLCNPSAPSPYRKNFRAIFARSSAAYSKKERKAGHSVLSVF